MNALDILLKMNSVDFAHYSTPELIQLRKELVQINMSSPEFKSRLLNNMKRGAIGGTAAGAALTGIGTLHNLSIRKFDRKSFGTGIGTIVAGGGIGTSAMIGKAILDYTVKKKRYINQIDQELLERQYSNKSFQNQNYLASQNSQTREAANAIEMYTPEAIRTAAAYIMKTGNI